MQPRLVSRRTPVACLVAALALSGCAEWSPSQPTGHAPDPAPPLTRLSVSCVVSIEQQTVRCGDADTGTDSAAGEIIGGQGVYVRLTSSNVSYDAGTGEFEFDVTVQNLLNESIGTPGSGVPDPHGIRVFFAQLPHALSGTGTIEVDNPDGLATFTTADQPYFTYPVILAKNEVSPFRRWRMTMTP